MNKNSGADPMLIRCTGCEQESWEKNCAVSCDQNAVVVIRGDILVEQRKCGICEQNAGKGAGGMPGCIAVCENAAEKRVMESETTKQKQIRAASVMPWLS
jgi:Fe-S-cluster-containing hydrogenase component 2